MTALLLAARLAAAPAFAASAPGGKILAVSGRALVRSGSATAPAAAGRKLAFGDEVRTLSDGLAQISVGDGAVVLVKPNSAFLIGGTPRRPFLSFTIGEFLIGLKRALRPDESFRVRTPAAVAAVRGTLFWGLSEANNDAAFACLAHRLEVSAGGTTVTLGPGQKTKIPFGRAPAKPEKAGIPASFLDTFAVQGGLQGVKDLLAR